MAQGSSWASDVRSSLQRVCAVCHWPPPTLGARQAHFVHAESSGLAQNCGSSQLQTLKMKGRRALGLTEAGSGCGAPQPLAGPQP